MALAMADLALAGSANESPGAMRSKALAQSMRRRAGGSGTSLSMASCPASSQNGVRAVPRAAPNGLDALPGAAAGFTLTAGAPLPMRPSLWQDTTSKLPAALGEARQLGERLNLLLDDANRRELASLLANLNRFSAQLPALGEQSTATLASTRQLADELRQLSQGLRAVLAQAGPAVGQASARLNQDTLPRLDQLASQAEHTAQALDGLIDSHSRRPQQLLLGAPMDPPGPGEAGFAGAAR